MKKQVQCLECKKQFFSSVETVFVGMARKKDNPISTRLIGGSRKEEEVKKTRVGNDEILEVKKILAPKEQFCLHCRMKHMQKANVIRSQDKRIQKMRALQLGQNVNDVPIRAIPEDEARAFDRFMVYQKVNKDFREKIQAEQQLAKDDKDKKEIVDAAMQKLAEIKKEREKNVSQNGGQEGKGQEDSK